jgi:AcrR family transcriptional regulator
VGIKERKQRDFERRKKLILKTAKKLFSRKKSKNVTLEEIASEIEFSKGTIYSHFASKEEIFAELLLAHLNTLLSRLENAVTTSKSTLEGIKNCLEAYIRFYEEHREYFNLLFFFDLMGDHYKVPKQLILDIRLKKIACLVELQKVIKMGLKSPEISTDNSIKDTALVLWGMINGIIHLLESNQIKKEDFTRLVEIAFKMVTPGIKKTIKE